MTDLEMLKHGKSVATALLLFAGVLPLPADEGVPDDSTLLTNRQLSLQEVLVVSHKAEVQSDAYRLITQLSRSEIESLPIQTVADILQYLPGVDIRTRGANGAQADISMRGGTFDQVLVLLNGVPLSDFQTGHYALNLPITPSVIERIEVLQGTSANLFGAFSGAINIITKSKISHRPTDMVVNVSKIAANNIGFQCTHQMTLLGHTVVKLMITYRDRIVTYCIHDSYNTLTLRQTTDGSSLCKVAGTYDCHIRRQRR